MADTNASASARGGIGFTGLLLIILVVLKLNPGGHLDSPVEDWSWWLVIFGPILLSLVFTVLVLLVVGVSIGLVLLVAWLLDLRDKRKREKARRDRLTKRAGSDRFS